jgi:hypothetical protein
MHNILLLMSVIFYFIILCIAAKPKAIQFEEPPNAAVDQNISGNTSQDREFIRFKE